jgi:hypothetical protein
MRSQRNVFIVDYGNRSQAMGLPYHYSRLGHRVFMLKPGEFKDEWNWKKIPIWPRLLHKEGPGSSVRNLQNYRNEDIDVLFGEDSFLEQERDDILKTSYDSDAHVTLVTESDLKTLGKDIDIFHTTEFCIDVLDHRVSWAQKFLPKSSWISSCFNPAHVKSGHPGSNEPDNVCILMPSPCEYMFPNKNRFHMFRHEFEFDLLGINQRERKVKSRLISSFMNNFSVRDPIYYKIFKELEPELKKINIELINFGANIRSVGADIRYSGGGPTGSNFETLSVRQSCFKYLETRAVLHMKGLDWAGGVPAHAQMSGTPFITIAPYIQASNYGKYYNIENGTVICNSIEEIFSTIVSIVENDDVYSELSKRMLNSRHKMFDNDYWNRFDQFIEKSAKN